MNFDLEAIKARAETLQKARYTYEIQNAAVALAADIPALLAEVERCHRLMQSTYDALIQGSQTYYIRWRDAMNVLEGRKTDGAP